MKRLQLLPVAILLTLGGCSSDDPASPVMTSGPDGLASTSATAKSSGTDVVANIDSHIRGTDRYIAILSAEDAQTNSRGRGVATFTLSEDHESMSYRLNLANIQNVTMAHIHIADPGMDGPVAVWLFPEAPPATLLEGRVGGVVAEGTIEAGDLMGPLEGMTIMDLAQELWLDRGYVNVHTQQFAGGEIRGRIDQPQIGHPAP